MKASHLLLVVVLVAVVSGQPSVLYQGFVDLNSGLADPFVYTGPVCPTDFVAESVWLYDGGNGGSINGVTVLAGNVLGLDTLTPFPIQAPSYSLSLASCASFTPPYGCVWEDQGLVTAVSVGDNVATSFQFGFVLNSDFVGATDILGVRLRYDGNNELGGTVGSAYDPGVGNSLVSRYCINATDIPTDADIQGGDTVGAINAPTIRFFDCINFDISLGSCDPGDFIVGNDPGDCSASVPDLTDLTMGYSAAAEPLACPVTIVSAGALDPYPVGGATTVDYTTTVDANGSQVLCSTDITVNDTENPIVVCPPSQTLEPEFCTVTFPTHIFTDNCPGATDTVLTATYGTDTVFNVDVDDAAGNTNSCNYVITVVNEFTFPNCPLAPLTADNDPGKCTAFINVEPEVGTVPVGCPENQLFTNYPEEGYDYPVGTTTFLAISNYYGYGDSCSFDIQVSDVDPPTIECPLDIDVTTEDASGRVVNYALPIVRDNCIANTIQGSTANPGDFFPVGTTLVDYFVFDGFFNVSCDFTITVDQVFPSATASSTPVFIPSPSESNTPTRAAPPSPQVSRDVVSTSPSNTPTRSNDISVTSSPTRTPSPTSVPSQSRTPSTTPSSSSTNTATATRTPSPTPSPDPSISDSRSPYVPSSSASSTPAVAPVIFVQEGRNALVELIIPCQRSVCTTEEVQIYLDEIAIALGISFDSVQLVNVFGDEVTFLICGSDDIADLLNDINSGDAPDVFDGTFVEGATFNVSCGEVVIVESSNAYSLQVFIAMFALTIFLL